MYFVPFTVYTPGCTAELKEQAIDEIEPSKLVDDSMKLVKELDTSGKKHLEENINIHQDIVIPIKALNDLLRTVLASSTDAPEQSTLFSGSLQKLLDDEIARKKEETDKITKFFESVLTPEVTKDDGLNWFQVDVGKQKSGQVSKEISQPRSGLNFDFKYPFDTRQLSEETSEPESGLNFDFKYPVKEDSNFGGQPFSIIDSSLAHELGAVDSDSVKSGEDKKSSEEREVQEVSSTMDSVDEDVGALDFGRIFGSDELATGRSTKDMFRLTW